jgi:two-component system NtrC family sensor kinase
MIEEIKTSEEYYRSFVEFSQDLIANISGDGTILTINPAGRIITEFSKEDITGKNILSFITEGHGEFKGALDEALRGNTASVKFTTKLSNGNTIWWDARLSPIRDSEGRVTRILLVARDVTQDMKYREAILQSQEMLVEERNELKKLVHEIERAKREWERTLDCVDDMIILTDDQGKIRRVNKAFKEFTGKSYKEILGQNWEDIIVENGFETTTFYVGGIELYHPETKRWFILNSYPYEDAELNFSGIVITIHENTEIKKITAELEDTNTRIEKNRKKLQNALNQISKLIESVRKQASYGVRFSNPHLRRCYEVKKCTKVDCPCYGKEAMRCWQIAGTFCGGEVQGAFAQKYKTCSECEVYKYATSDPIYEIGEQFNNMMHVLELKNKELENALNKLKATQAQMLQQEKMASIGQLAAGVAHEINNPMGFITSNLGTLSKYTKRLSEYIDLQTKAIDEIGTEDVKRSLAEQRKKLKIDYILEDIGQLIEESLDGAERVRKIVQNLKSFSRVDEAEYKFADINECIESTLNIVWNELKYKAKVYKEYGELPLTKCYPQQLNQVFMNILVNAAQAIEKQGEIRIKTWNGDGNIYIAISDTGVGIPKDKINRIFEPFFTTKPVGKGTGLGLSITYDIIKKHNGDIQVESEVGKGTTFTIRIPVVEDDRNE